MSNKIFNGNNTDYLIEGASKKGYLKSSGKGYGDGKTSDEIKSYDDTNKFSDNNWFQGNKPGAQEGKGPQGKL